MDCSHCYYSVCVVWCGVVLCCTGQHILTVCSQCYSGMFVCEFSD